MENQIFRDNCKSLKNIGTMEHQIAKKDRGVIRSTIEWKHATKCVTSAHPQRHSVVANTHNHHQQLLAGSLRAHLEWINYHVVHAKPQISIQDLEKLNWFPKRNEDWIRPKKGRVCYSSRIGNVRCGFALVRQTAAPAMC